MLLALLLAAVAGAAAAAVAKLLGFASRLQRDLLNPVTVQLEDFASVEPIALPSIFSPSSKALSVIVPAFNEEERLGATLEELLSYLQRRRNRQGPHFTYEVIVVDDGSRDRTVRVASEFVKKYGFDTVRVLRVRENRGKGHAVHRGMLVARGEYCLFADADGATRIDDLELLEGALAKSLKDGNTSQALGAAFGSRAHMERAAMSKRNPLRNFLTRGFHFLVTFVAGDRIRDTQCGFKLFTRHSAAQVFGNQRLQRWCFDVELLYLCDQLGIPIVEVFVHWTEMPGSKIRATSVISMAIELLTIKMSYAILGLWPVYSEAELASTRVI